MLKQTIDVCDGKYTLVRMEGDKRIHLWKKGKPFLIGNSMMNEPIAGLMDMYCNLFKAMETLTEEAGERRHRMKANH